MIGLPANPLFCLVLLFFFVPAAVCGVPVTRTLSTAEPGAGEVFDVSPSAEWSRRCRQATPSRGPATRTTASSSGGRRSGLR